METINNVALAASKAVWGDSEAHKEPVSGAKGDVAKGEPFDAGNLGMQFSLPLPLIALGVIYLTVFRT